MVSTAPRRWAPFFGTLLAAFSSGCYGLKQEDPGVALTADATGYVNVPEVGIVGKWYAYGDRYDEPRRCLSFGRRAPEHCSSVLSPQALPTFDFPNHGSMCLTGVAAQVLPCLESNKVECVSLDEEEPTADSVRPGTVAENCGCGGSTCLQGNLLCYCGTSTVQCTGDDNSNIWGVGIGLDFNLANADGSARNPLIGGEGRSVWNPEAYGITGVAFDFSLIYGPPDSSYDPNHNANLRVEFPMELPETLALPSAWLGTSVQWVGTASIGNGTIAEPSAAYPDTPAPSEEHPEGSPFWDAAQSWDKVTSPVRQGHNVVHFSDVNPPPQDQISADGRYDWDETKLLGIQFHVPTRTAQADPFSFCISNLTLIRN